MTAEEYANICLKFAEATKDRGALDENEFYTTFDGTWEESPENQNGGVGIEWAFHKSEDEIRKNAPQKLLDYIADELNMAVALGGADLSYTAINLAGILKPGICSNSEIK